MLIARAYHVSCIITQHGGAVQRWSALVFKLRDYIIKPQLCFSHMQDLVRPAYTCYVTFS